MGEMIYAFSWIMNFDQEVKNLYRVLQYYYYDYSSFLILSIYQLTFHRNPNQNPQNLNLRIYLK